LHPRARSPRFLTRVGLRVLTALPYGRLVLLGLLRPLHGLFRVGKRKAPRRRASWRPIKKRPSLAAEAHRRAAALRLATPIRCAGRAGCPRSSGAPVRRGGRRTEGSPDVSLAIAAMDRGDRSDGTWMCHRAGPAAARVPGGQDARRARRWGVLSLAYFSLDKQREVGRGPGMARGKGHGRRLKRARRTNLAAPRAPTEHGWRHSERGIAADWAGVQPRPTA
jgi:hypothetical protein